MIFGSTNMAWHSGNWDAVGGTTLRWKLKLLMRLRLEQFLTEGLMVDNLEGWQPCLILAR